MTKDAFEKCPRCDNEADEQSGCPFAMEICLQSEEEALCKCCEECRNECLMDI